MDRQGFERGSHGGHVVVGPGYFLLRWIPVRGENWILFTRLVRAPAAS